jgi:hypothetical protein
MQITLMCTCSEEVTDKTRTQKEKLPSTAMTVSMRRTPSRKALGCWPARRSMRYEALRHTPIG